MTDTNITQEVVQEVVKEPQVVTQEVPSKVYDVSMRYTNPKRFWLGIGITLFGTLVLLASIILTIHTFHVNKGILVGCLIAVIGITLLTETMFGYVLNFISIAILIWGILQTKW